MDTDPRDHYRMSAAETAARLGLSVATIYRMAERREIDHVRLSGSAKAQLRFSEAGLDAWIESRRVRAVPAPRDRRSHPVHPRPVISDVPLPSRRYF